MDLADQVALGGVQPAEVLGQYLKKGRPLFVEGRLKYDQWDDKNGGGKRSKISVVVENFQFLGSASSPQGGSRGDSRDDAPQRASSNLHDTGKPRERALDQPAASGAMHAFDQHDRLACPVGQRAHEMARQLGAQEGRRARLQLARVGRPGG